MNAFIPSSEILRAGFRVLKSLLAPSSGDKPPVNVPKEVDWTNLPANIYPLIFRTASGRKTARLVCKTWRFHALSPLKQLGVDCLPSSLPDNCPALEVIWFKRSSCIAPPDWSVLTRFKRLYVLRLDFQLAVDNRCLEALSHLEALRILGLAHCENIGDIGLRFLSVHSLWKTLETLDLSHCSKITDVGIDFLSKRRVVHFSLQRCTKVSGWGLRGFASKDRPPTRELRIINQWLVPPRKYGQQTFVDTLPLFHSLRMLDLSYCTLHDSLLRSLCGNLKMLKRLFLTRCDGLSSRAFTSLSELKSLERLSLGHLSVLDHTIYDLGSLGKLEWFNLTGCVYLTKNSAEALARIPNLKEVILSGCNAQLAWDLWSLNPGLVIVADNMIPDHSQMAIDARESNAKIAEGAQLNRARNSAQSP